MLTITDQNNNITNQSIGQIISDTEQGITNSAKLTNKIETEDPKKYTFNEEQINECKKMTVRVRRIS